MASATPADLQHDTAATMATAAKPSFLGVPAELFERFAQFSKPKDLLALRLTCKDAAAKVLRTYAEVHFSHRHILLTEETSLRDAIDVAQHPAFGPALRKLSIHVDEAIESPGFPQEQSPYETDEEFQQQTAQNEERQQLLKQQYQFRNAKLDLYLLTVLLAQARMQNAKPEVTILDACRPHHWKPRMDDDFDGVCLYGACRDADRSFMIVLEALSLANLEVHSVELDVSSGLCYRDLTPRNLRIMAHALRATKRVRIAMVSFGFPSRAGSTEDFERRVREIALALSSTDVEILRFSFSWHVEHPLMRHVLHQQFPRLRELTLDGVIECNDENISAFAGFVRRQPALQTLCLEGLIDVKPEEFFLSKDEPIEVAFKRHTGVSEVKIDNWEIFQEEDSSDSASSFVDYEFEDPRWFDDGDFML